MNNNKYEIEKENRMNKKYEFVFITLVYRDTIDILEFISSVKEKISNYKIVIVNAHFDKETDNILAQIAKKNNCDIINIDNGGYGYGNNKGINYVNNKYIYDYLVIANPDTVVEYIDIIGLKKIKNGVIAPVIRNLKGKNQNPYWAKKCDLGEWLIYKGCLLNKRFVSCIGYVINRIVREICLFKVRRKSEYIKEIFAAHGSFLIFSCSVIDKLGELYDDKIFMFAEEADLAYKLKKNKIKTYYTNYIRICHKEDGCIKQSNINENEIYKNSIIYYYEKVKRNKNR